VTIATSTPISYDVTGAAASVGLSPASIRAALNAGDLTARFFKSKRLIGHDELLAWFRALPVDPPETG
jgi:hypothetical protein